MNQPINGPEDDGYIGYMLSDVARLIRTVFDRRVRDMGLTRSQWLVLTRVYRRPWFRDPLPPCPTTRTRRLPVLASPPSSLLSPRKAIMT